MPEDPAVRSTVGSRSSQLRLPLVRRAHLKPYEDFLRTIGAPVFRYLQRTNVPRWDEPGAEYMTNRGYFEFVGLAATEQGIPDLGYRACKTTGRRRLSGELVAQIERSPTLYGALKGFISGVRKDATHIRMGLVEEPDRVVFWQRSADEAGPIGWDISEQMVTLIVLDLVRLFAGPQWYPRTIRSRVPFVPTECKEHVGRTRLYGGGLALCIPIRRSLLHLPPLVRRGRVGPSADPALKPTFPGELPAALCEAMKGHLRGGRACLDLAADMVSTSPRTLQRHLNERGTSFSRVLRQARFEVAAKLLADDRVRAIDVAYAAGYSDPSNFSRAFRSMAGMSPTEYRKSLAGAK